MKQASFAIEKKLSDRLRKYRIDYPMTQKELAEKSGVSVRSIQNFENGADIQFGNLIKLLNAMDLADNLEVLIPDVDKKPSMFLENAKKRERAPRQRNAEQSSFRWGDEQ